MMLPVVFALTGTAFALVPRQETNRFDPKIVEPPSAVIPVRARPLAELPPTDALRTGWEAFGAGSGGWTVFLDQRSGLPTLAHGAGIAWLRGDEADPMTALEARARAFFAEQNVLLGDWTEQLEFDTKASGPASDTVWNVVFRQVVNGVPVDGARFDFQVVHGNLVAFGAERWSKVSTPTAPRFTVDEAWDALLQYLEALREEVVEQGPGELHLVTIDPRFERTGEWTGVRGAGLDHLLVWRYRFRVPGEAATWVADVDARLGTVVALFDETHYARVKGGVFPESSDGDGYRGTEQPAIPMPFADFTVGAGAKQTSSANGLLSCSAPGEVVTTNLSGPYVSIHNLCGPVNETALCGEDIDLQIGPGTNCETPAGASAGNTRGARTAYYHVNRIMEHARYWLPDNSWIRTPLIVNVNVDSTCNASLTDEMNLYRAGDGCRNTAELRSVIVHEWGHGLDKTDGGGYDNSTEAYADVVAAYDSHLSCIGLDLNEGRTCTGYGDTCLECTGVRDIDWAKRAFNRPATPQDFVTNQCASGDGPCGRSRHCESYPAAEALWDLAVRDLPASGLDAASAWQLADRLWYQSRKGSGGNAYNCALPNSDGCGTVSWFHKLRVADDDDGNLANGTPHAAAIFAAFKRHNIACGAATDASNQNRSSCPSLAAPALSVSLEPGGMRLNWTAVPSASKYRILRADFGCDDEQIPIADVAAPTTTFLDTDLAEYVEVSYRVQAVGANAVCESRVSACLTTAFKPLFGRVEFLSREYGCGSTLTLRVHDGNAGAGPLKVAVWSDSEQTPEVAVLNETGPGSAIFEGTLLAGSGTPVKGDGRLVYRGADQITAEYIDVNDGTRKSASAFDTAVADCSTNAPTSVQVTDLTDFGATIQWATSEWTTGRVEWGTTTALGNTIEDTSLGTEHAVSLTQVAECGKIYFRVVARDEHGNESILAGAGGQPFSFVVGRIPGFFRDDFEGATSPWTFEGEWQFGAPEGKGTHDPDPTAAFSGTKVLGHDLTGIGARPGDYEQSTTERTTSPVIDATGKSGVEIKFRRWLNFNRNATATVEVSVNNGAWQEVWRSANSFNGTQETVWSLQTIAVPQANNQSNVRISYKMAGGSYTVGASGWNVDRFVMRLAADPQDELCGGCGSPPSFAGLASAVDADVCSTAGGVVLSWEAAPAWGTGGSGTYSIYRDTVANFAPTAANRIAVGLNATTYTDSAVANGVSYYYLVRAENNETCSTGPNNGGAVEANTVYRSVTTSATQAVPGAVAGLRIQLPIGADLRLTWDATAGAASYRVLRSASPQPAGFGNPRTSTTPVLNLVGDAGDGSTWFFLVRATNACSQSGP